MKLFFMLFTIFTCLIGGLIGGYTLDRQTKAEKLPFTYVYIPEKYRKFLRYDRFYGDHRMLLMALLEELCGIIFTLIICAVGLIFPNINLWVLFSLWLLHAIVIILIAVISYIMRLRFLRNAIDRKSFLCEFQKLLSWKMVYRTVEIVQTPESREDGMYLVKLGSVFPKLFRADTACRKAFPVGTRCRAMYMGIAPHFLLLPD